MYTNIIKRFDALNGFLDHVLSIPETYHKESKSWDKDFTGTYSIAESVNIAKNGFDLDKISIELGQMKEFAEVQIVPEQSVSGAVVDMAAFLEGIPENMIDFPLVDNTKFIDVIIDLCEMAGVDQSVLTNKAIALACLVDHLENNGYRTKVIVTTLQDMTQPENYNLTLVTVKDYQEPLSVGQLAGCMHAGFFRRLMFLVWEGEYKGRVQCGYGRNMSSKELIEKALADLGETDAIFIPNSRAAKAAFNCPFFPSSVSEAKKYVEFFATKMILEDGKLA